jgi:hypothetical protein
MEECYVCGFHGLIVRRRVFNNGCVHGISWRKAEILSKDQRLCGAKGCLRLIDEALHLDHGLPEIVQRRDTGQKEIVSSAQSNIEEIGYDPETGKWEGTWLRWYQILSQSSKEKLVCGV